MSVKPFCTCFICLLLGFAESLVSAGLNIEPISVHARDSSSLVPKAAPALVVLLDQSVTYAVRANAGVGAAQKGVFGEDSVPNRVEV
jgi:hypothetical protein